MGLVVHENFHKAKLTGRMFDGEAVGTWRERVEVGVDNVLDLGKLKRVAPASEATIDKPGQGSAGKTIPQDP